MELNEKEIREFVKKGGVENGGFADLEVIVFLLDTIKARDERIGELEEENKRLWKVIKDVVSPYLDQVWYHCKCGELKDILGDIVEEICPSCHRIGCWILDEQSSTERLDELEENLEVITKLKNKLSVNTINSIQTKLTATEEELQELRALKQDAYKGMYKRQNTQLVAKLKRWREALELAHSYMLHGSNWQGPMIVLAGKSWPEDSEKVRLALASSSEKEE